MIKEIALRKLASDDEGINPYGVGALGAAAGSGVLFTDKNTKLVNKLVDKHTRNIKNRIDGLQNELANSVNNLKTESEKHVDDWNEAIRLINSGDPDSVAKGKAIVKNINDTMAYANSKKNFINKRILRLNGFKDKLASKITNRFNIATKGAAGLSVAALGSKYLYDKLNAEHVTEAEKRDIISSLTGAGLVGSGYLLNSNNVTKHIDNLGDSFLQDRLLNRSMGENLEEYDKLFKHAIPDSKPIPLRFEGNSAYIVDRNSLKGGPYDFGITLPASSNKNKTANIAALAHEIGHYKTLNKDKKKLLYRLRLRGEKASIKPLPVAATSALIGSGAYGLAKTFGASDENAMKTGVASSALSAIAPNVPTLTDEFIASVNGLKALKKYNETAKNKVPLKRAAKGLAKAFSTYLYRPTRNALLGAGAGLLTMNLLNRINNLGDKK